jgi:phosphoribosylpyrophosphate synthetase
MSFITVLLLILGISAIETEGFELMGHITLAVSVILSAFGYARQSVPELRRNLVFTMVAGLLTALIRSVPVGIYLAAHGVAPWLVWWARTRKGS